MIKKVLLSFLLSVAIVAGVIFLQGDSYTVVHTTTIAASPDRVFANVNDFHLWNEWSPWAKIDPAMKQAFSGAPAGTGAVYKWSGNKEAGEGSMTMSDSVPADHITIQLAFTRPYVSESVIGFAMRAEGAGTKVSWTMHGRNNFALKAVALFSSMDKLIGPDFERGLKQLKAVSEAR
jgi:uncharacterized protein YndB with AHSA1/START domain